MWSESTDTGEIVGYDSREPCLQIRCKRESCTPKMDRFKLYSLFNLFRFRQGFDNSRPSPAFDFEDISSWLDSCFVDDLEKFSTWTSNDPLVKIMIDLRPKLLVYLCLEPINTSNINTCIFYDVELLLIYLLNETRILKNATPNTSNTPNASASSQYTSQYSQQQILDAYNRPRSGPVSLAFRYILALGSKFIQQTCPSIVEAISANKLACYSFLENYKILDLSDSFNNRLDAPTFSFVPIRTTLEIDLVAPIEYAIIRRGVWTRVLTVRAHAPLDTVNANSVCFYNPNTSAWSEPKELYDILLSRRSKNPQNDDNFLLARASHINQTRFINGYNNHNIAKSRHIKLNYFLVNAGNSFVWNFTNILNNDEKDYVPNVQWSTLHVSSQSILPVNLQFKCGIYNVTGNMVAKYFLWPSEKPMPTYPSIVAIDEQNYKISIQSDMINIVFTLIKN